MGGVVAWVRVYNAVVAPDTGGGAGQGDQAARRHSRGHRATFVSGIDLWRKTGWRVCTIIPDRRCANYHAGSFLGRPGWVCRSRKLAGSHSHANDFGTSNSVYAFDAITSGFDVPVFQSGGVVARNQSRIAFELLRRERLTAF